MLGRHLLEEPARAAQLKVDAERGLQERREGSIQLLDEHERRHSTDLDLAVEPKAGIRLGLAFAVRRRLDGHEVAVVSQLDPRHRNPRTRSGDVRAVGHVDEAARAPGALDRDAQVGDQLVEALDEGPRLAAALDVIAVLADGPKVVLPAGRQRTSQRNYAGLQL